MSPFNLLEISSGMVTRWLFLKGQIQRWLIEASGLLRKKPTTWYSSEIPICAQNPICEIVLNFKT